MKKITLERVDGAGWMVSCGDEFSSYLAPDEALGVFATALFGNYENLPYLNCYRRHIHQWDDVAGLLPETVEPMPISDFVIWHRELIADAKGIAL